MKEIFRASSPARVGFFQTILDDAGILNFVRNEIMQQAIPGGLAVALFPLPDFWPTLCVIRNEDYAEAMELLSIVHTTDSTVSADWRCGHCDEIAPGNFTSCWNCGVDRLSQRADEPLS